jgi:peptide/nickel transport system ATP-binding protein
MLKVRNLNIKIENDKRIIYPVRDVSFSIDKGEIKAIIGETGCGKTQTAMAINQLNRMDGFTITGTIEYKDIENIITLKEKPLNKIRGSEIAYIDQDPMEALNPSLKIGYQIKDVLLQHGNCKRREAKALVEAYLKKVGISDIKRVYKAYPHQLSGGMQQRVSIAMALISEPSLVIADEPTTALDVEMERKILELLIGLQKEMALGVLMISHDLSVVKNFAHKIVVMYGGEIVETYNNLIDDYKHPYTKALVKCMPIIEKPVDQLKAIPGQVFDLSKQVSACHFYDRCTEKLPICLEKHPEIKVLKSGQEVRCFLYD